MAKTREEKVAELTALRSTIEEQVREYNEARQEGQPTAELDEKIKENITEYTSIARDICFCDCAETDDPMLTAVKTLSYEVIGVKDTKKGDEKIPVREVVNKEKRIELFKLNKHVKDGIGKDWKWAHMIERMTKLYTVQKAKELCKSKETLARTLREIDDSNAMKKLADDVEMGKNPVSNTNLLKTLTAIVQAMLGEEYKATSHDVRFLKETFAKKSNQNLRIKCSNAKGLCDTILQICHSIVTGEDYGVEGF